MTFPVFGGGFNASAPAFPVQRSIRLRNSASAYFSRTPSVAGNRQTWTWSGWVKRGTINSGAGSYFLLGNNSANNDNGSTFIYFYQDGFRITGFNTSWRQTTQVFRDPSAWYHIVIAWDTTQATGANRVRIYVNGVQVTAFGVNNDPVQNTTGGINAATVTYLGADTYAGPVSFFDGYLTEVNFIDGYPTVNGVTYNATTWAALNVATLFGSYNIGTGVWQPLPYRGTYGTNGYYLNFQDNSAATAAAIGKDSSGNGNNWTPSAGIILSPTTSAAYDSMVDVPTLTSTTNANFPVLNTLVNSNLSSGNLQVTGSGAGEFHPATILLPTTGKWYCEMSSTAYNASTIVGWFGVANRLGTNFSGLLSRVSGAGGGFFQNDVNINAVNVGALNTIVGIAVNRDANTVSIYLNNVLQATAPTMATGVDLYLSYGTYTSGTGWVNFGQRPFTYPIPTGYLTLNTYNLPTSTIINGAAYMAATTYTGTGAALSIANTTNNPLVSPFSNNPNAVALQPDFVWYKDRIVARDHGLFDSVRGVTKYLGSNLTTQESTVSGVDSFNSNGFTLGTNVSGNAITETYVAWQWKAGAGTTQTISAGAYGATPTIASTVSVNQTAGFSIVSYTGTGVNATVGHGLGVAPSMVIVRWRTAGGLVNQDWDVYHTSVGATKRLFLNSAAQAQTTSLPWNDTAPTTNVFSIGTGTDVNQSGASYVAYCWAEIPGYSKFGSYVGNSGTNNFVYTGFRPRFVMTKATGTANGSTVSTFWCIWDTSRSTYNASLAQLYPNSNIAQDAETSGIDILSNGFNLKRNSEYANWSGTTYIFIAFAENPFKYSLAR